MNKKPNFSLIAAVGENGVIGSGGKLPAWKLTDDMKRFARLTKEYGIVIVGRRTHESILKHLGRPLSERVTIVLTRKLGYESKGCIVISCWENMLSEITRLGNRAIVIGGAEIYRMALPHVTTMYLTRVHGEFEGNVYFPEYDENEWEVIGEEKHPSNKHNTHTYTFFTLKRKKFVNLDNARLDEQYEVLKHIQDETICPFCLEHLHKFHIQPIIRENDYWVLTYNQWPYENTRFHLLAIAKQHAERLSDLPSEAGHDLLELLQWAEQEFSIAGGGIGLRFGDIAINGASVRHLHAQLLSADITDRNDPGYKPVRFRVG